MFNRGFKRDLYGSPFHRWVLDTKTVPLWPGVVGFKIFKVI